MESWLGGNNGQKIILKERTKKLKAEAPEKKHELEMGDVDEVEDINTSLQENPFKQELVNFEDLNKRYTLFKSEKAAVKSEDLSFLAREFACHESLEEPDVAWDFKTLRTEIAAIISAIYDIK